MDYFDILILIDMIQFFSSLFFLFVYLTLAICPTKNTKFILQINDEEEGNDFLEESVYMKNMIIQIFSFSITCIIFLMLIKGDAFQVSNDF
jgi:hypothetical protein